MYWFPLPFQLPVVICDLYSVESDVNPKSINKFTFKGRSAYILGKVRIIFWGQANPEFSGTHPGGGLDLIFFL